MSNMASDAKACFSSKVEYRVVIRYLYLKGKTGKGIHDELADVYGSYGLFQHCVHRWCMRTLNSHQTVRMYRASFSLFFTS